MLFTLPLYIKCVVVKHSTTDIPLNVVQRIYISPKEDVKGMDRTICWSRCI